MSNREFDDFDDFASTYRETHNKSLKISGTDSDYFSEHKICEIRNNENLNNIIMLDLGCGDGNSAKFFQKHFENSKYYGLDVSKESIAIANEKNVPNSDFLSFDGSSLPFEDNSFDIILIACVLHHINFDNHEKLLDEVKRVLRVGGKLYIFEHNPFNPVTQKIVKDCPFDKDAVLLSPTYTKKTLLKTGFKVITTNFIIFFPRNKVFNKFLFLEKYFKKIPIGGQYYTVSSKS